MRRCDGPTSNKALLTELLLLFAEKLEEAGRFCPLCGQAWAVHNDDGSCVQDEPNSIVIRFDDDDVPLCPSCGSTLKLNYIDEWSDTHFYRGYDPGTIDYFDDGDFEGSTVTLIKCDCCKWRVDPRQVEVRYDNEGG